MSNAAQPVVESSYSSAPPIPAVGSNIEVFWAADGQYYPGTVSNYDPARNRHTIVFDSGNSERLILSKESWRMPNPEVEEQKEDLPEIGAQVEVWWPLDKEYYKGTVRSYDARKKTHHIKYDDGESEKLVLSDEVWRYTEQTNSGGVTRTPAKKGDRPEVGDDIEVYWPEDEIYYPGTVASYNAQNEKYFIKYLDGEQEHLKMDNEKWRFVRKTITKTKRKGGPSSKRSS